MAKVKTDFELLEGKMRLPIHINYLAKYVLKKSLTETQEILDKGIEMGLFELTKYNGYYQLKSQK